VTGPESLRAKPLKIGDIEVANRVFLAPMSGVTDAPFRRLTAALGAGLVVSEMTASDDLVHGRPMSQLRCEAAGIGPHVVQLAGCEVRWMAEGARIAEAAGAEIIDINMGCPARHVTGGQSGSALMRDLDHALKLIEATIAAVKVPVTLKMRLGWDERSLNAPELARRAEAAGVQMISVHGRTRCQFYKGDADWGAVRAVKDAITIPLVVNGDITSFEKAVSALEKSGADAVMAQHLRPDSRQRDLPHCRGGLAFLELERSARQFETAASERDRTGGHDQEFATLAVQPGEVVGQRREPRGAHFAGVGIDQQG